jgi:sugar (pentulose or hexulose) kinase
MNPPACVLGIDVGSSAVRIVAIGANASIRAEARANIEPQHPGTSAINRDPAAWWQATRDALVAIAQHIDLEQIQALSIDATSGTILGVDQQGRALTGGSLYNDTARSTTLDSLAQILPDDSAAHGATSPLARMLELQRPGIHKLLHQADWLTGLLTGRFDISDENNALKSGFDPITRAWPAWIADTGLDPRLLPHVVPPGTDLGCIRPEVAAQFGFSPNLRIAAGTTDGCAAFIATDARSLGDAVTSLGTTLTLKQLCAAPIAVAKFGIYSHRLGDFWLCGGASNSGGAALLKFFSREQLTELEARLLPDQAMNLGYYPLPGVGERFPHADSSFESVTEPRPQDDARFLQGLLEGIASIEKAGYARLHEFGAPPLKQVISVGGGSHNEPWRRIRERMLGIPVSKGSADAGYGAALIALSMLEEKPLFSLDPRVPGAA